MNERPHMTAAEVSAMERAFQALLWRPTRYELSSGLGWSYTVWLDANGTWQAWHHQHGRQPECVARGCPDENAAMKAANDDLRAQVSESADSPADISF